MIRWAAVVSLTGCAAGAVSETDEVFFARDGERVLCGLGVDGEDIAIDDLEAGMIRARDRGEVLSLFAHQPGGTISIDRIDAILAAADRVGLPSVTFPSLATAGGAGLAFGFDDAYVAEWMEAREVLAAHGAKVTFFVSNFGGLRASEIEALRALAADGHAIEAHGMGHRNAPEYVDEHGLARYLADEIDPMLAAMAAEGFTPTTFAYPFGDRTPELDAALLARFDLVRSLSSLGRDALDTAPCPY